MGIFRRECVWASMGPTVVETWVDLARQQWRNHQKYIFHEDFDVLPTILFGVY